uniref:Uncharacterized protein n=1 Tax=Ditylenchus dipsaci TaxID=166011 RepID=A0A915E781_9BILA
MIEKIERRFPEGVNPALAHHWQMASACIQFDYNLFYGIEPDLELLEGVNFIGSEIVRFAKGIDLVLTLRCLMILGLVYCEGGAIKTGIKTLEDVLLTSIVKSMKNFVCMIKRRLAYAYMINGISMKPQNCWMPADWS